MTSDRISGIALALFGGLAVWQATRLPLGSLAVPGPGYLPTLLGSLLALLGLIVALLGGGAVAARPNWREMGHALHILGACAFAALALESLGYRLTMAVVLVYLLGVVERQNIVTVLCVTLFLSAGSFYLFYDLLHVLLPTGPWGI